ncbi:MAG: OB-fold protein [Bacteroidia bacterium]
MKNWKKIGIIIALLFLVGVAGVFWIVNKPHKNIESAKPDFQLQVSDLIAGFAKEDSLAHARYFEKVIELTGEIEQVQQADSVSMLTFRSAEKSFQLSCMMDPLDHTPLAAKQLVKLKCLYAGYLSPDEEFELPGDIKCKNCFVVK